MLSTLGRYIWRSHRPTSTRIAVKSDKGMMVLPFEGWGLEKNTRRSSRQVMLLKFGPEVADRTGRAKIAHRWDSDARQTISVLTPQLGNVVTILYLSGGPKRWDNFLRGTIWSDTVLSYTC